MFLFSGSFGAGGNSAKGYIIYTWLLMIIAWQEAEGKEETKFFFLQTNLDGIGLVYGPFEKSAPFLAGAFFSWYDE